jgi:osmoprotectant transport system permease protein
MSAAVTIGSKNFNEGYLLAEMAAQLIEDAGIPVTRRFGLGRYADLLRCLDRRRDRPVRGVHRHPEPGHSRHARGRDVGPAEPGAGRARVAAAAAARVRQHYAIAMKRERAEMLGIETSPISRCADLRVVVSHEFLSAPTAGLVWLPPTDCLSGSPASSTVWLTRRSRRRHRRHRRLHHRWRGRALRSGAAGRRPRVFPEYLAVPMVRGDLPAPAVRALAPLAGLLDNATMQALNAAVVFDKRSFAEVANELSGRAWARRPHQAARGCGGRGATPGGICSSPPPRWRVGAGGHRAEPAVFRRRLLARPSSMAAACCRRCRPSRCWR